MNKIPGKHGPGKLERFLRFNFWNLILYTGSYQLFFAYAPQWFNLIFIFNLMYGSATIGHMYRSVGVNLHAEIYKLSDCLKLILISMLWFITRPILKEKIDEYIKVSGGHRKEQ